MLEGLEKYPCLLWQQPAPNQGKFDDSGSTTDHIIPYALHGSNDVSMLQLLCANCHKKKTEHDNKVYGQGNQPWPRLDDQKATTKRKSMEKEQKEEQTSKRHKQEDLRPQCKNLGQFQQCKGKAIRGTAYCAQHNDSTGCYICEKCGTRNQKRKRAFMFTFPKNHWMNGQDINKKLCEECVPICMWTHSSIHEKECRQLGYFGLWCKTHATKGFNRFYRAYIQYSFPLTDDTDKKLARKPENVKSAWSKIEEIAKSADPVQEYKKCIQQARRAESEYKINLWTEQYKANMDDQIYGTVSDEDKWIMQSQFNLETLLKFTESKVPGAHFAEQFRRFYEADEKDKLKPWYGLTIKAMENSMSEYFHRMYVLPGEEERKKYFPLEKPVDLKDLEDICCLADLMVGHQGTLHLGCCFYDQDWVKWYKFRKYGIFGGDGHKITPANDLYFNQLSKDVQEISYNAQKDFSIIYC